MIDPDDVGLIKAFVARFIESRLSAEAVSKSIGGKPSAPTILRYKRGIYPKERLDRETRRGIDLFMTGRVASQGGEHSEYDRHLEWLRGQEGSLESKTAHLREVRGGIRDESLRLLAVAVLRAEDNAALFSQERSAHREAILRGDEPVVTPAAAHLALKVAGTAKQGRRRLAEKPHEGNGGETAARSAQP